ncbi:hypothetical protein D3C80_1625660 [compost metagenome]
MAQPSRPGAMLRSLDAGAVETASVLGLASPVVAQADRLRAPIAQVRTARLGPRRRLSNMSETPSRPHTAGRQWDGIQRRFSVAVKGNCQTILFSGGTTGRGPRRR